MASYDIGPKISIKGETEFNKAVQAINSNLRVYKSEMGELTSRFDENADSQEALIAKNKVLQSSIDDIRKKTQLIAEQINKYTDLLIQQQNEIKRLSDQYGENSSEVAKAENAYKNTQSTLNRLQSALYDSTSSTNKFTNELRDNEKKLSEIDNGTRDASTGLSKLGNAADDTSADMNDLGNSFKEAFSAEAISDFASSAIDSMKGVVEESKEYIKVMGSLEVSSQSAGYTNEQTTETFKTLYGVLADDQTAATTTANLQALKLSQEQLNQATLAAIGGWAKYGDSIPIDGLAESMNETIKTATVTGTFADILNWAGTSEDVFNEKLQACTSESERANLVLQEMANQGLIDSANAWMANNDELVKNNQAQAEFNATMAELAETMMPLMTELTNIMNAVMSVFNSLPEPVQYATVIILALLSALGSLAPIITAIGFASSGAAVGTGALSASLLPIAGIVLGIIAAIAAIILIVKNWGSITKWFGDVFGSVKDYCVNIWGQLKDSWNKGVENLKKKMDDWVNDIAKSFSEMVNSASEWGKDMLSNFANGIASGFTWVKNQISNVINWIKERLHFSVPDKGPLSDADTWMPDFMQLMAKGIKDKKHLITEQIDDLTAMMNVSPEYTSGVKTISENTVVVNNTTTLDGRVIARNTERHIGQRQTSNELMKGAYV